MQKSFFGNVGLNNNLAGTFKLLQNVGLNRYTYTYNDYFME